MQFRRRCQELVFGASVVIPDYWEEPEVSPAFQAMLDQADKEAA